MYESTEDYIQRNFLDSAVTISAIFLFITIAAILANALIPISPIM